MIVGLAAIEVDDAGGGRWVGVAMKRKVQLYMVWEFFFFFGFLFIGPTLP